MLKVLIKMFLNDEKCDALLLSIVQDKTNAAKLEFIERAYKLAYEPLKVDRVNSKLIRPVIIIDGVQYYEFISKADMPDTRFAHYLDFVQEFNLGMRRDEANEFMDAIAAANNKNDASRIGSLVWMFKDTINNCTPLETLYNMASLVYFDKDEDLKCYDADYNAAKIKRFKSLKDRTFFLTRLLEKALQIPGGVSPSDMLKSLNESAVKMQAYRRILSESDDLSD